MADMQEYTSPPEDADKPMSDFIDRVLTQPRFMQMQPQNRQTSVSSRSSEDSLGLQATSRAPISRSVGNKQTGGTPVTFFAWKDGVVGTIDVVASSDFSDL